MAARDALRHLGQNGLARERCDGRRQVEQVRQRELVRFFGGKAGERAHPRQQQGAAPGGAQEFLGITPDLCTLGKAVGGGYPLSVFGGRHDLMARLMPQGDCQHSGTYNGHPSVIAAGLAAVQAYRSPGFYDHIRAVGQRLFSGLQEIFTRRSIPARVQGLGARFGIYFGPTEQVTSYDQVQRHSREQMLRFIAAAVEHGIYFHDYGGAACHHGFCHAMTLGDVEESLQRLNVAVASMA